MVKSVRPMAMSIGQAIAGRGRMTTGSAAMMKRSAPNCAGEKLSSPNLMATKPRPQITETSAAKTLSRVVIDCSRPQGCGTVAEIEESWVPAPRRRRGVTRAAIALCYE